MDGGEEESVKWSESDFFVRKDEKSGRTDKHSEKKTALKHGCLYRTFSFFSWIISVILVIILVFLIVCIIKSKQGNQNGKPVHSKLSSEPRTGGNSVCVPCQGKEFLETANISLPSERLCCSNSQSLNTLVKLVSN